MIEFTSQNPKLCPGHPRRRPIGWLNRTRDPFRAEQTIWSGIVDNRVIKQESLCAAKRQAPRPRGRQGRVHDLTEAGRKAIREYGPMHRAKVRVAAARGVTELENIAVHFRLARRLADGGDTVKAIAHLEPLKDALAWDHRRDDFAAYRPDGNKGIVT